MSKRLERIARAAARSPEERAGIVIRKLLNPVFHRRLRRFDLGTEIEDESWVNALCAGAMVLLREDGIFVDGLEVRGIADPDKATRDKIGALAKRRILLTCVPKEPDHA